jgi:hypothetical protein
MTRLVTVTAVTIYVPTPPPLPVPTRTMAYPLDSAANDTGKIYMHGHRPYYSRLVAVIGSRLAGWCWINKYRTALKCLILVLVCF